MELPRFQVKMRSSLKATSSIAAAGA